jgi:hypothetical protein
MKKNIPYTNIPQKKRRRKRGRPAKYRNPVGRPKKFADPVELHLVLEKAMVNHLDALVVKLKASGVETTRSEIIRICVSKMIKM